MTGGVDAPASRDSRADLERAPTSRADLAPVDGSRRVTHITEVLRMESDVITSAGPVRGEAARGRVRPRSADHVPLAPIARIGPEAALPREDGFEPRPASADRSSVPMCEGRPASPPGRRRCAVGAHSQRSRSSSPSSSLSRRAPAGGNTADHGCGRCAVLVRPRHRGHASAHRERRPLSENGQPVIGFSAKNFGREKSVVLLFDRSQSMLGQRCGMRLQPRVPSSARSQRVTGSQSLRSGSRPSS